MPNSPIPNASQPQDILADSRDLINTAKEVVIMLPTNPTFDSVASALSLYLALNNGDRNAIVACPSEMTVEFSHLTGVDKVQKTLGGSERNLVVSFPYQEGSIEKVSYNIENDTFNLIIEPREGYPTLSPDNVNYSYGGGGLFDTIITVGVPTLNDLGSFYNGNEGFYQDKPIINVDYHFNNNKYGNVNILDTNASCESEMVTLFLRDMGLNIDKDTATNLMAGINKATNNFAGVRSAKVFEAAALCMNAGGQQMEIPKTPEPPYSFNQTSQPPNYQAPAQSYNTQPAGPTDGYNQPPPPITKNYNSPPMNQPYNNPPKPLQNYNQPPNTGYNQPPKQTQAPKQPFGRPANVGSQPPYKQPGYGHNQYQPKPAPYAQQPKQPPGPNQSYQPTIQQPVNPPKPQMAQPASQPPINTVSDKPKNNQKPDAPPDWLKPKIYKGSTLL